MSEPQVATVAAETKVDVLPASAEAKLDALPASPVSGLQASPRKPKQGSALGASLGAPNPTLTNTWGKKPEVSQQIAHRYRYEVAQTEQDRKEVFVPLAHKGPTHMKPHADDMMRSMRKDLDSSLSHFGAQIVGRKDLAATTSGWDGVLGNDLWQKRMKFLHEHARTGHFVELYGGDGRYEGDFLHGMRHGKGRHEFRGDVYDGEWKWDQRHGWGKLALADGTVVTGEWEKGKEHGFITVVDRRGTITYEGEYRSGKRDGLGRQLFESGDMYDGSWAEGKLHDRGVYYFTNGDKLYGMWSKGLYNGSCIFHYSDGSISRRLYKEGLLISVQDYEHSTQRFGKTLRRDDMQKHTRDKDFPREIFMMNAV